MPLFSRALVRQSLFYCYLSTFDVVVQQRSSVDSWPSGLSEEFRQSLVPDWNVAFVLLQGDFRSTLDLARELRHLWSLQKAQLRNRQTILQTILSLGKLNENILMGWNLTMSLSESEGRSSLWDKLGYIFMILSTNWLTPSCWSVNIIFNAQCLTRHPEFH